MNLPSEQELLKGARAFDQDALAAIYDLYSPGIYRYAIRLLGDDTMAEDCLSETFSRFLKMLRGGQGPQDHLQAYLYRIAHNLITDSYRRQPPPPLELDESLRDERPHPEKQVDDRLQEARVRLAMRALTPEQRQVITLRFVEGWENDDVAVALQRPVGAVKALQHRALGALKRLLLGDENEGAYESE
jgi:RNA polymerase sigma-70 factor, ECF subfamily